MHGTKTSGSRCVMMVGALLLASASCSASEDTRRGDDASSNQSNTAKVGFVYLGPVGDGGWTYSHDQARIRVESLFKGKVATSYRAGVSTGAEAEKAFRELAANGHQVIFGTSYGYKDAMLKVAKEYPQVKFHHVAGGTTTSNLSVYEARTYEAAYLAGVLAGKVTKTGKLGFVASVPVPEVYRNINAFTLGAQSVNPSVSTQVSWVNSWIDPKKERETAVELIDQGADVLIQNTDSPAVLKAAQERGVKAFGWNSDTKHHGMTAHIGSAVIDWAPYYAKVIASQLEGRWKQEAVWLGARSNVVRLVSPSAALPQELLLLLGEKTHELRAGKLHPFKGPVTNRDGNIEIETGAFPDDDALRRMDYFVKGVRVKMPPDSNKNVH